MMWNHNVFHGKQLDLSTLLVSGQPSNETQQMIIDKSDELSVNRILDYKWSYWKLHYLIQWVGFRYVCTSWKLAENDGNFQELVDEFHCSHLAKPPQRRKGINYAFFLSFFVFLVIGCNPVQMALAWVLPPSDHSQVEVEIAHATYPHDD